MWDELEEGSGEFTSVHLSVLGLIQSTLQSAERLSLTTMCFKSGALSSPGLEVGIHPFPRISEEAHQSLFLALVC